MVRQKHPILSMIYIMKPEPMIHANATAARNSKNAQCHFLLKGENTLILREGCRSYWMSASILMHSSSILGKLIMSSKTRCPQRDPILMTCFLSGQSMTSSFQIETCPCSLYIEWHSSYTHEDEREVLKDLLHSNFVVVEVEKVVPYIGYHVVEIFLEKEHYFITDTLSTRQISNNSLLLLKPFRIKMLNRIGRGALKIPSVR